MQSLEDKLLEMIPDANELQVLAFKLGYQTAMTDMAEKRLKELEDEARKQ